MKFVSMLSAVAMVVGFSGCQSYAQRSVDSQVLINQLGPATYQAAAQDMDSDVSCKHVVRAEAARKICLPAGKTLVEEAYDHDVARIAAGFGGLSSNCTMRFSCK